MQSASGKYNNISQTSPNFRSKATFIAKLPFISLLLTIFAGLFLMDYVGPYYRAFFFLLQVYGIFAIVRTVLCVYKYPVWDRKQAERTAEYVQYRDSYMNHMIVITIYKEDIEEIKQTLDVLAKLVQAKEHVTIALAMEKRVATAPDTVAQLTEIYASQFREILHTLHESQPGEIAGKGSNAAWLFNKLVMSNPQALEKWDLIHILDVDTHHSQEYFNRIEAIWSTTNPQDRRKLFFACPIAFNRNYNEVAWPVRMNDTFWSLAGLTSFYTGTNFAIPTSTYCMAMELAVDMGGWDATSFGIGEDFHTAIKAHCQSGGNMIMNAIYEPASSLNVTRERVGIDNWFGDVYARYQQGCRHLWGVLTFSYLVEQYIENPSLLKKWASWVMLMRAFEPFTILYLVTVSWTYLAKTWNFQGTLFSTWINGVWFIFVYIYLCKKIYPKWNINMSNYEIVKSIVLFLLCSPFLVIAYTVMPTVNSTFRHLFGVSYSGWTVSNAKPQENTQQAEQTQFIDLESQELAKEKENIWSKPLPLACAE